MRKIKLLYMLLKLMWVDWVFYEKKEFKICLIRKIYLYVVYK